MYLPIGRQWSKRIAVILIILGITIMNPPGMLPDDFINIILGSHIASLTGWSYTASVIFTYFIGIPIFLAGLLVYPYNTRRLFASYCSRGIRLLLYMLKHPIWLIGAAAMFMLLWYAGFMYYSYVAAGVEEMLKNSIGITGG